MQKMRQEEPCRRLVRSAKVIVSLTMLLMFPGVPAGAQTTSGTYLAIVRWTHLPLQGKGQTACIIVGADGQFHMESAAASLHKHRQPVTMRAGYLSEESFQQLKNLLDDDDLIALGSNSPPAVVVVRQETEMIGLRVHREKDMQELTFADGDGKHPTPASVLAFVGWIKDIEGVGDPLDDKETNLCRSLEANSNFVPQLVRR